MFEDATRKKKSLFEYVQKERTSEYNQKERTHITSKNTQNRKGGGGGGVRIHEWPEERERELENFILQGL